MKKSLFLAVIPALLVLSACQGVSLDKKNNLFLEDTLAHEEIFANKELSVEVNKNAFNGPAIRKAGDDPIEHLGDPAIGVQTQSEGAGLLSFRFVAAVAFTNENIGPTEARWTRTVSKSDGSAYPMDTGTFECSTAYTKISNGGSAYSISQFNTDNGTSYTHFVVYTLRNVPVDSNDYYVSAYLNLSGEGGVSLTSKAIAVRANDVSTKFAYAHNLGTFFLDGDTGIVEATSIRTSESDSNKASFEGLSLNPNDTFVVKEFYNTKLYIHGSTILTGTNNPIGYYFSNSSGSIKTNYKGSYNLFLNKDNELWTAASNVARPVYINVESWWFEAGCHVAMRAYDSSNPSSGVWFSWDSYSTYLESSSVIDPSLYDKLVVVRVGSGEEPSVENPKYENRSSVATLPSAPDYDSEHSMVKDCLYVYGGSDPRNVSWGSRS